MTGAAETSSTGERALRKAVIPAPPRRHWLPSVLWGARVWLLLVVTMAAWQALTTLLDIPRYLLPSPASVIAEFVETPRFIIESFLVTMLESVAGFAIAAVVAFGLAVLMSRSAVIEEFVYPYLNIVRVMPIVAVVPLLIIWFGHGMTPMIIVAALIAFFPIVVNTILGLRSVDPDLVDLMHTLNAKQGQILRKIRVPNALPYVLSAFRISAPGAVIGALVGEFVGGARGLGYLLVTAHGRIDTSAVFLMVVLSVLLGLAFFGLVVAIERRTLRWHPSTLINGRTVRP